MISYIAIALLSAVTTAYVIKEKSGDTTAEGVFRGLLTYGSLVLSLFAVTFLVAININIFATNTLNLVVLVPSAIAVLLLGIGLYMISQDEYPTAIVPSR